MVVSKITCHLCVRVRVSKSLVAGRIKPPGRVHTKMATAPPASNGDIASEGLETAPMRARNTTLFHPNIRGIAECDGDEGEGVGVGVGRILVPSPTSMVRHDSETSRPDTNATTTSGNAV